MTTNGNPRQDPYIEHLDFLMSSFTDNGKSLRGFTINPQELAITILTSGLLSNSKLMITPEDAIKSAFDIHKRIQYHVANHQNVQFAAKIENVFEEKPPEIGCSFQGRCPRVLGEKCFKETPPWQISKNGNAIRCHIDIKDLLKYQISKK